MTATLPSSDLGAAFTDPMSSRLLKSSARHSYDPDVDLDWNAPPVPGLWWMQPERTTLYGTALWDSLRLEQQQTLAKHEVASIMSVGLWFEILLMQILLRDVYHNDPRAGRTHYALTEIADECRHSTMFGKALATQGMPYYGPQPLFHKLGRIFPAITRGAGAYASILIGEEPVDRWQRAMMADERLQPMTRMVSRIHVTEEARHVTFARDELEKAVPKMGRTERLWQQTLTAQGAYIMMRSLVHPDVYTSVGIDPALGRRTALGNANYRGTIAWMGEKVMPYLTEQGMVGKENLKVWRASFLLP